MRNRYKGQCHTCFTFVPAGDGYFDGGYVTCTEPITKQDTPKAFHQHFNGIYFMCLAELNRRANTDLDFDGFYAAAFQEREDERIANQPTPEELAVLKAEYELRDKEHRKLRRAELKRLKEENICPRCDGKGGSDAWLHTGWTCHRCFGSGKYA